MLAVKIYVLVTVLLAAITLGTTYDTRHMTPAIGRDLFLLVAGIFILIGFLR